MQKYSLVPKVRVLSVPKRPVVEMVLPVAQEILDASGLQILGQVEIASSVLPSFFAGPPTNLPACQAGLTRELQLNTWGSALHEC